MRLLKHLAVGVMVGASVIALAASGDAKKSGDPVKGSGGDHPALADVSITKCALPDNQFEGPEATLSVKNNSSKASNYIIAVAFESPDGTKQLDTGDASVQSLAPGQSTEVTATSLKSELRSQQFTCKVSDVTRLAS
jgi:hypothetical protein